MSNNKKNTTPPVSGDNLSNELLRMVINSSPHITVLFDDKFGVIQCNPAALKFLLFESLPDLISGFAERLMSSVPPHQPDGRPSVPIIERFVTAAKDGVSKFETVLILNDIMHHVSVELIRIFYEKSFVIVAYVIDLTQQNTRELELIKAHELNELHMTKMELMIKSAGIGLWDMEVIKNDPINPANVFNWSDEFRQMIGFTDENDFPNVLSSWSDRLHPDDKEYTLKAFKKHLTDRTGKIPYDVEYRLLKKDWTYSYYHATGETVRDKNGDAIRVAGALMDISEEKQMTEALKDSVDGLERTQKMMHGINTAASFLLNADVDSFESAYLTAMKTIAESVNVDRMYIWKNYIKDEKLHCLQIFEWYKDEKLQHKSIVFDIPYEGNITGWEKLLSEGNCVNEIVKDMSSDEKDLLEKQGIVSILVVPIFIREVFWGFVGLDDCVNERVFSKEEESILRSGSVLLASAWLRNSMVKDLRETSVQLEAALIRAEDANNAKSNFLSTVSHEIRTPMNAILGITEIQLQTESLEEDVRDAFDRIYVSGDLLLGIINDILDLSKIEADMLELMVENYDISSLIIDTAQLNMMRIGSKPIEFKLHVDENTPFLLSGDELRIKQILNNLLSNAFKYTESGTVSLSIHAEAGKDDDSTTLIFTVTDTGLGMTSEQLDKLFEEYSRFNLETNRSIEGTGLGMSIVKKLVHMMDGEIIIESKPNEGSTFTVRVPQVKIGAEVLGAELAEGLEQFKTNSRSYMKRVQITRQPMPYGSVLIVDDVETNIYVATGLLVPYGLKIDSATGGFEAIEKIKKGNVYDIIFMDQMMPKIDGIQTTKIIKDMGYKNPIVALTANVIKGQADMFLEHGFDDFIAKPIDIRQMNTVLNKFVRDRHPEAALTAESGVISKKKAQIGSGMNDAIKEKVKTAFVRDATKAVEALKKINKKRFPLDKDDIRVFDTFVHGMKGALTIIGQTELSAIASELEMSVQNGETEIDTAVTAAFVDSLRILIDEMKQSKTNKSNKVVNEDKDFLREKLLVLKAACDDLDEDSIDDVMAQLGEKTWSEPTAKLIDTIAGHLLHSDFTKIEEVVKKYLGK